MRLAHAALLIVALTACGGALSADQFPNAAGGRIAFAVNRDGWNEIWTMRANGKARRRLTRLAPRGTDASGNQQPAWAPSGDRIAYIGSAARRRESESDLELYLMRADGSGKRRVTSNQAADLLPSWSPDGARIAFARGFRIGSQDAATAIYTIGVDGREEKELVRASIPTFVLDPAWSPDGRSIAYARTTYTRAATEYGIYVINSDGSSDQKLIGRAAEPAWSPDAKRIAFVSDRDHNGRCLFHDCEGFAPEVYLMRADGSEVRRVTHSPATDVNPAWSPDEKALPSRGSAAKTVTTRSTPFVPTGAGSGN